LNGLTQIKGDCCAESPGLVSGMFKPKLVCSIEFANSAIFNKAVPTRVPFFLGLPLNPYNYI